MIDPKKTYKTRDGREVRIYAVDGNGRYPVHGAVKEAEGWRVTTWDNDGIYAIFDASSGDLVEVKPRIKREVWVNVYRHDDGAEFVECCESRVEADEQAGNARIACVRLTIDCEEGEGL